MHTVGLWINAGKPNAQEMAEMLETWFLSRGWTVVTERQRFIPPLDFVISLGGDGTLLEAARELSLAQIPVLGVNLGRLGFLCELEKDDVFTALAKVLQGEYIIQKRMMLQAWLFAEGEEKTVNVLNDVVFLRDRNSSLVTLQADLAGEPSVSYPADGLIVATPTGSTAYSLSAGGPIVSPDVEAVILSPLAAHSLSARPMVVSAEDEIDIILERGHHCRVTFDGQFNVLLLQGERIRIKKSPLQALMIRLGSRSFPAVVREKLMDRWHD